MKFLFGAIGWIVGMFAGFACVESVPFLGFVFIIGSPILGFKIGASIEEERENDYNQLCALSSNLYTLQEAYDKGLITKEDLKAICYFRCYGFVYERVDYDKPLSESEAIEKIDYEPSFELGELDKETERKIKGAAAYWWKGTNSDDWSGKAEDVRYEYYGTYNKCVAVEIIVGLYDIPQEEKYLEIDGIVFRYTGWLPEVWVENDY